MSGHLDPQRLAVRVHGRGVITTYNDAPITSMAVAEEVVRHVQALGETASIEACLLEIRIPKAGAA